MRKLYLLKDLLTIKNGTDYREEKSGNIPVYGSGGIMTYIENYLYNGESILLPRKGTLNNIMYVNGKFWTVDTMYWSIVNKNIANTYFLSNYLKCLNLEGIQTGSTLPSMTNTAYYGIPVLLPDLKEQNVIAKVLSSIDDKIALNNKINAELEQIAKTLYNYWFVQFEFPDGNEGAYKSSNGQMVYNEILKREIPVGWEVGCFEDFIDITKNGDWGKDKKEGNYINEVSCIRGADISSLLFNGNINAPQRFILEKNSSKILKENDLIIEISGGSPTQSTGRICYINHNTFKRFSNQIICSNFCRAISLKNSFSVYNFYLEWMRQYNLGVLFNFESKTTGIKNLLFDDFITTFNVIIPPEYIQKLFFEKVSPIFNTIQLNNLQTKGLENLRDFLLPLLMNGQIKVEQQKSDHS